MLPYEQVGNHPALDFLNTRRARAEGAVELLTQAADLADWFAGMGWTRPAVEESLLSQALGLREAIRTLLKARVEGEKAPHGALSTLNAALERGTARHRLDVNFHEEIRRVGDPLSQIAEFAVDLLCHQDMERIRQCDGTGCVLWFLDTSKNGKRRWCSMAGCGNREKAAAHFKRARG